MTWRTLISKCQSHVVPVTTRAAFCDHGIAGMARFTCHNPHNVYDIIPCDVVASTILAAAAALLQVTLSTITESLAPCKPPGVGDGHCPVAALVPLPPGFDGFA